ncbi:translation initiation factor IF-3 [Marinospirillum alkaliphilum]|uniref:Translation initiation factor IF-3 n=1 Tax=Marinospirillum alkaliphilum DSM 21637 TaxID=1122209 RepID=A0A1K1XQ76_9GAMM|nr:translation initiation factor IF-3 [Marinospirillum alkaliphilum]SFX51523.1 translation initiation factor IF-3 [Marinospirillum alkaliphilum DSM 21637]
MEGGVNPIKQNGDTPIKRANPIRRDAKKNLPPINENIQATEVRLIDQNGEQVGVVPLEDALERAAAAELDLVKISDADPIVCKIMDYGKFQFEQKKAKNAQKKKQKQIQIKELKFRPGTEDGDYQIKLRNMVRFLEDGDKVKVTLRFRGREMAHQDIGMRLFQRIEEDLGDTIIVESRPRLEGRQMVMMLAPKKK